MEWNPEKLRANIVDQLTSNRFKKNIANNLTEQIHKKEVVDDELATTEAKILRASRNLGGIEIGHDKEDIPRRLNVSDGVLVKAQNVYDYFRKHFEEHKWNDLTSFVCVKPGFELMLVTYDDDGTHVGVIVQTHRPDILNGFRERENILKNDEGVPLTKDILKEILDKKDVAFVLHFMVGIDGDKLPGGYYVLIDKQGQVLQLQEDGTAFFYTRTPEDERTIQDLGVTLKRVLNIFSKHVCVACATLQFMNCKNVEVIDNPPSRQSIRAAQRQNRPAPTTYKTLRIVPLKKVFQNKNKSEGQDTNIQMSLHICRGHFKDFRQGPGLGKNHRHGLWWWAAQVRGRVEVGRVEKDYEVEP